jgi:hypothetical protein
MMRSSSDGISGLKAWGNLPLNAAPTSLAELANRGEFAPIVIKSNSIQYMTVTNSIAKDTGGIPFPRNSKQIFSRCDNKAAVFVNSQASTNEKVAYVLPAFHGGE